jgi:2-succinyl-5-enolpyruvyl-6-hydroxy-3-cyclohexene-1-carboxylate synthase
VVAAGPLDGPPSLGEAVSRLARAARWPVLAEPTSQLRAGPHVAHAPILGAHDSFLRDAELARSLAPGIALRLGAPLTSKAFNAWLASHDPALWIADPDGRFADPTHSAAEILRAEPELLCDALAAELEGRAAARSSDWLERFLAAERRARTALEHELAKDERALGPRAVAELADALPAGAALFVSNSLPIRDLDSVFPVTPRPLRVLCNRGANGIDGIVSTALGAAAAGAAPLVLLTGDLALLHDLGGLLAARRHGIDATIVVLNNDGGGIFSLLPVAAHRDAVDFETHFATPHGLDLSHAAALFGAAHSRVTGIEQLRLALKHAIGAPGLYLVEVPFDREVDAEARRALLARVAREARA